jgi:hypothetical protein
MSAGNFTFVAEAKLKILNQTIKLNSDTFKLALTNSSVAISPTFTGTSTNAQYSDIIAGEVQGSGYTAGGQVIGSPTLTLANSTVTFNGNAVSWTSATIAATNAVVYSNTATNKDILGYMSLDSNANTISSTNGTFTVSFNAAGLFTLV